jgi:arylsulfatase A-like enzyme
MLWEFAGYRGQIAIRDGRWKAVRQGVRSKKPSAWELYDMENDLSESEDVAKNHPDIVAKLENAYLKTRTPEPDFPLPLYDNPS